MAGTDRKADGKRRPIELDVLYGAKQEELVWHHAFHDALNVEFARHAGPGNLHVNSLIPPIEQRLVVLAEWVARLIAGAQPSLNMQADLLDMEEHGYVGAQIMLRFIDVVSLHGEQGLLDLLILSMGGVLTGDLQTHATMVSIISRFLTGAIRQGNLQRVQGLVQTLEGNGGAIILLRDPAGVRDVQPHVFTSSRAA